MCVVHLSLAQLAVIPQAILIEMIFHVFGMCLPQWSRFLALKFKKPRSCHRFTGDCLVLRYVPVHMFESLIDFVYHLYAKSAVIPLVC